MGISYYLIKHFGLPLTYSYATLRKSVAGNSTFQGIVYCNLGTPKTVISNFVTTQIDVFFLGACRWLHVPFFFRPLFTETSYVRFVLARDHLGIPKKFHD